MTDVRNFAGEAMRSGYTKSDFCKKIDPAVKAVPKAFYQIRRALIKVRALLPKTKIGSDQYQMLKTKSKLLEAKLKSMKGK